MNATASTTPPLCEFAALVAFDWSDHRHDIRLLIADQTQPEALVLPNTPEALHGWIGKLHQRVQGKAVAVAFEAHRGGLLHLLMGYQFLSLYPINPKSAARFREAFYPSGSKSDSIDAELLLDMLQKHRQKLQRLAVDTAQSRLIGALSEQRRKWVAQRTELVERLWATLMGYFPQAIELSGGN